MGVVIFILVVGYLPFTEATENDKYFQLLQNGERDENGIVDVYWRQYRCPNLSLDFKLLIQQILIQDQSYRLNLKQIQEHNWFTKWGNVGDLEQTREALL